ncbi:MAG: 16S rRNA (uracil(1498)-N(3))-methyltransferase [Puniceicoccaceae bacterium]
MNRILFESQDARCELAASDPRLEHVRGVLRMKVGDSFDVGVVNGPVGKATIRELGPERMQLSMEWGERPPLPPDIHLLVGMCRPATARKILATVPTLGVRSITFASCGRSDPAYGQSSLWKSGEWRKILLEGVEQAFDTYLPAVEVADSITSGLAALPVSSKGMALDVYEGTTPLSASECLSGQPVCLAIGPERGWNKHDREAFRNAGFELVSLGERVLRVETAVTVALTLVLAQLGLI